MSASLFAFVRDRNPDLSRPFLETPDGRKMSYGELFMASARFANALRALGVDVGDRVAVQAEKSPEVIILLLACARAGAIFLPLNTAYTTAELEYFIGDAEPALFVCDASIREAIAPIAAARGVKAVETLNAGGAGTLTDLAAKQDDTFDDVGCAPGDLAAILYTSGTTGRSKGAMLTHENLVSNALTLVDYWRFTKDDVLLHALPTFHTHGLFVATNTLLMAGGSLLFTAKFDADEIMRLMPRATSMMGVPTFYVRLLQHPGLTREATRHMRLFVSGSAPLLAETHRAFSEKTGHAILERYGMTETNMNTSNPYDGARVPGTVGFPLPDVDLRVVDPETGAPLGVDEIGMIEVRGPNVFKGYWRNPGKTAAEFRADGFFITGDLGKVDPDGYVHIVGRGKDLIITGGYNVYPKEVETEIDGMDGVVESAVFGLPHPDFGEGVTAAVVLQKGAAIDEKAIASALEHRLARFKQPKRVMVLPELPRNTMGKVQKNVLRDTYKDIYAKD
ncbi:MAG: malonyl-CoA synthase [Salinarimonadaceae bacterium]|nr:MAG: malonyl-CoA synthase [Salinarimonadaceae bacterium]